MIEAAAALALVAGVVWGVAARPGLPFSWTMFSGSSKAFLWLDEPRQSHVATPDELRLTPDSHYLLAADLERLAEAGALPALHGLVVGSRGSRRVAYDASLGLRSGPVERDDDLAELVAALRRHACPPS